MIVLKCPCCEQKCPKCLELGLNWDHAKKFRGMTRNALRKHRRAKHNCNYKCDESGLDEGSESNGAFQDDTTNSILSVDNMPATKVFTDFNGDQIPLFPYFELLDSETILTRYQNDHFVTNLILDLSHQKLQNKAIVFNRN